MRFPRKALVLLALVFCSATVRDAEGQTCSLAPVTIDVPSSMCGSTSSRASVVNPPADATYAWSISGGSLLGAPAVNNRPAVFFRAYSSGTVTLNVTVTTASGCSTGTQSIPVNAVSTPYITVPDSGWCPNSGPYTASAMGAMPDYQWSILNGTITGGQGTPNVQFTTGDVSPTLLYVVGTTAAGCSGVSQAEFSEKRQYTLPGAPPASIGLAPTRTSFKPAGGSGSIAVHASCAWTASSSAPWVTVTSGASGSGDGTIAFTVAPHSASRAALTAISTWPTRTTL